MTARTKVGVAAQWVVVVVASCSRTPSAPSAVGRDGSAAPPAGPASVEAAPSRATGPYKVATFNAGLAVGVVSYASERAAPVISAISAADVDLLCLQELWLDEHWKALVAEAQPRFSTALRIEPTLASADPLCTQAELAPLRACATASCAKLSADRLASCVIRHCAQVAERVSVDCANCVARNPTSTLEAITEACLDPREGQTPRLGARAGMVAYGGSYGLGLLTRSKVLERDELRFRSALNPRGVLYAKVLTSVGDVHVFCTHLTPDIAGLAHPTGGSWRRDHEVETQGLIAFVGQKASAGAPAIILGDLNAGPSVGAHIGARLPDDYRRLITAGFQNPYVASGRAACTFCNANPLLGGEGKGGSLIDHILVRDIGVPVTVSEFLREPISLPVAAGRGGRRAAYSDHYGLAAVMRPPPAVTTAHP